MFSPRFCLASLEKISLAAPESLRFGVAEGGLSCFGVEVTIVSSTSDCCRRCADVPLSNYSLTHCCRRLSSVTVSIEEFRVLTAGLFAPL